MSLLTQSKLLNDPEFYGRVNVAVLTAASLIVQEEGYSQQHPTTDRHFLASQVSLGWSNSLQQFMHACALNTAIADAENAQPGSSSDNDIQYVVNSNWDRIASIVAPLPA